MNCLKCKSEEYWKDRFIRGRQRYRCKECGYRYAVEQKTGSGNIEVKSKALQLYLEGMGFSAIGRVLGYSNVTILKTIYQQKW